jgi:hypothetical protein
VPGSLALDFDAFEGLIVTYFLMSTDFFDVGDDPQASVTYVAFGDPYVSGCANRLARFN